MNYLCIIIFIIATLIKYCEENNDKEYKYLEIKFYSKYPTEDEKKYFNEKIVNNYLFSKIKFGSNEQIMEMKLELNNYQTYIFKNTLVNKQYNSFDNNSSKTFKTYTRFYSKNKEFSSGLLASDILIINNSTNSIKINNFYFGYIDNGFKDILGSIGFSLFKNELYPEKGMNLIDQLKNMSLINNYDFSFVFKSNNNYQGELYIGVDLSLIIQDKLEKYKKFRIRPIPKGYNEESICALDINEVYLGNYQYKIDTGNEYNLNKKVEAQFDLKYDFIMATDEFSKSIYKIFFRDLFSSLKCFRETFVYYSYFYAVKCEKSIDIKSFPDVIFDFSSEYEKVNIILDYNDLFEIKDDYIYFKIILTWAPEENISINLNWIFGKEFFKIFLINFNSERRDITLYYKKKVNNEKDKNKNEINRIFFILILMFVIMSGIIIFLVAKSLKLKRILKNKSRLNILEVELTQKNVN